MPNKLPAISIGMPVYNGEIFIREAIDSLLAQTFVDFELIISDNASTDNTGKICLEYTTKDKRIRYYRQDTNLGALSNFKIVLNKSSGYFFMWAAADDVWHPRWIEELLLNISDTDFSIRGLVSIIDANGCVKENLTPSNFSKRKWKNFILNTKSGGVFYIYGIFRAEQLKSKVDKFELGLWADAILVYSGLWEGNLRCIPSVWQAYRQHNSSVSAKIYKKSLLLNLKRLFLVNSPNYYLQYIYITPIKYKLQATIVIIFRYFLDQNLFYQSVFMKLFMGNKNEK